MPSTEGVPSEGAICHIRAWFPAHLETYVLLITCIAPLWIVIGLEAGPAGSAVLASGTDHRSEIPTSQSTTGINGNAAVPSHKESTLAVAFSFIGVIAVLVFVVALRSASVRRRTRNDPITRGGKDRGPPDPRRGWFG